MSTDKNNGNDGFTVGSKDYSTDVMYPSLLPFLANSPNLSRLLVNADVSDVAVSKLFVQGPVIILDLRDLPIEASYPVRGEGQVITVNRFTQHGIESHRLRHSLQVVPSRALVRPSLCFMES